MSLFMRNAGAQQVWPVSKMAGMLCHKRDFSGRPILRHGPRMAGAHFGNGGVAVAPR